MLRAKYTLIALTLLWLGFLVVTHAPPVSQEHLATLPLRTPGNLSTPGIDLHGQDFLVEGFVSNTFSIHLLGIKLIWLKDEAAGKTVCLRVFENLPPQGTVIETPVRVKSLINLNGNAVIIYSQLRSNGTPAPLSAK